MISNSGTSTLGLYDLKRQIDAFGGVDYFRPNLASGYLKNARVMLANGDIVKSTIDGNVNDPNVNMTGWFNESRFVEDKTKSFLDFGAKCDGVTDDSISIGLASTWSSMYKRKVSGLGKEYNVQTYSLILIVILLMQN